MLPLKGSRKFIIEKRLTKTEIGGIEPRILPLGGICIGQIVESKLQGSIFPERIGRI
jgi:hypothetical protein